MRKFKIKSNTELAGVTRVHGLTYQCTQELISKLLSIFVGSEADTLYKIYKLDDSVTVSTAATVTEKINV